MMKTIAFAATAACLASASFASDLTHDPIEGVSPEWTSKVQAAFANDFGPVVVGSVEAWTPKQFELVKAAFAAGS